MKNNSFIDKLKKFLTINFGTLLIAVGIYFFKAPNGFATGGVSGIAIVLAKISELVGIPITQSIYLSILNVILLVLGLILLGRDCGMWTIYCTIALSLENMLFEFLLPIELISGMDTLTNQPVIELIFAVLLTAIGSAILFRNNASSGGTDIIALIFKKFTHVNVGTALLYSDLIIASTTFFVYPAVEVGLYSLLGLFAKVFVVDDVLDSMNMCKAFTIITTKPNEIKDFILNDMNHSATLHHANGAYTGEEREIIITVCKRQEAFKLRTKVKEIDPHAFIIITKTSEIMGKGFRTAQDVEDEAKIPDKPTNESA